MAAAPYLVLSLQHNTAARVVAPSMAASLLTHEAVHSLQNTLHRLLTDEAGQDLIEYGLLAGILTVTIVTTVAYLGFRVEWYFEFLQKTIKAG